METVFSDPITLDIMRRPVIIVSGITYEAATVEEIVSRGLKQCPVTRTPLYHNIVIPNLALQSLVEEHCREKKVYIPPLNAQELAKDLHCTTKQAAAQTALVNDVTTRHLEWATAHRMLMGLPHRNIKEVMLSMLRGESRMQTYAVSLFGALDYTELCTCKVVRAMLSSAFAESLKELLDKVPDLCKGAQLAILTTSLSRDMQAEPTVSAAIAQLRSTCCQ